MDGLKGTHHIAESDKRGRWTLFPSALLELLGAGVIGELCSRRRVESGGRSATSTATCGPRPSSARVAFTLDDLRHTFASRLLSAGIPAIEVSAWMGHTIRAGGQDIANTTTRVYAHATGEWRQAAMAELTALDARRATPGDGQPRLSPSASPRQSAAWEPPRSDSAHSNKPVRLLRLHCGALRLRKKVTQT